GNQLTSEAGAAMLAAGGNAVDAAVAAAFVSFLAEVGVVHLGGSGIAQIFDPQTGRGVVYDFFSAMPGMAPMPGMEQAERPTALDFARVTIDFGATTQDFYLGRASVAVPGNIFGLCRLAADYGSLPLATLLQPAIELARDGVVLDAFQADTCELLSPLYTHTAGMRDIFLVDGRMVRGGERIFIPHLEETLRQLAAEGENLLRNGRLAQALLADQQANGGLWTAIGLSVYGVQRIAPIRLPYRRFEVLLPPPCSTGGVLTAFPLKLLSHFEVSNLAHGSAAHRQLLYEL